MSTKHSRSEAPSDVGAESSSPESSPIVSFVEVSKFYGEIQGVCKVTLDILPGITSLVGPNGSGKSTLLNLLAGLLKPSVGDIRVLGRAPSRDPALFHRLGYCPQYDGFPEELTGFSYVFHLMRLHGYDRREAERRAWEALSRVGMRERADKPIDGYSKGMRQRVKVAGAIGHDPEILLLDEPLNGLDPVARAELIALMRSFKETGRTVVISSHILHEVDVVSDRIVMMHHGYVVAEGDIPSVRRGIRAQPLQLEVLCGYPHTLASRLFAHAHVVEITLRPDHQGLLVRTTDAEAFHAKLNALAAAEQLHIRGVAPADEDVQAAYTYLIGTHGDAT